MIHSAVLDNHGVFPEQLANREALDAPAVSDVVKAPAVNAHTLTLQFGRFLSEDEWREVAQLARALPYVKGLRANAVLEDGSDTGVG